MTAMELLAEVNRQGIELLADGNRLRYPQQLGREQIHPGASVCERTGITASTPSARKSLSTRDKRNEVQRGATGSAKATERIRTVDLWFTKPLLCQLSYGGATGRSVCQARYCARLNRRRQRAVWCRRDCAKESGRRARLTSPGQCPADLSVTSAVGGAHPTGLRDTR